MQPLTLVACLSLAFIRIGVCADYDGLTIAFRGENPWQVSRLGLINADGSQERYLEFKQPNQKSWQLGPRFADEPVIVTSLEATDLKQIRAGQAVTNSWSYHFATGQVTKLLDSDPPSRNIYVQSTLPGERQLLALFFLDGEQRLYEINLDDRNQVPLT